MKVITVFLICLSLVSFQNSIYQIDKKLFCKTWVPIKSYDTYKPCRKFKRRRGGIKFNEDGTLVKKQNIGWCGTPPISYEKVSGNWKPLSNTMFEIKYSNWDGPQTDTFLIKNLSNDRLKMYCISGY